MLQFIKSKRTFTAKYLEKLEIFEKTLQETAGISPETLSNYTFVIQRIKFSLVHDDFFQEVMNQVRKNFSCKMGWDFITDSSITFDEELILSQLARKGLDGSIKPAMETSIDLLSIYQANREALVPPENLKQIISLLDSKMAFLKETALFRRGIESSLSKEKVFKLESFGSLGLFPCQHSAIHSDWIRCQRIKNKIATAINELEALQDLGIAPNGEFVASSLELNHWSFFEDMLFELLFYSGKIVFTFFEIFISFSPYISLSFTFLRILNFLRNKL